MVEASRQGGDTVTVAPGVDIYVERQGQGPPLLFLNGSGQSLEGARPLVDAIATRFDLVAHDQRGLGRTSVPPGPYSMADYAADAAAVLDHVGWRSCRVMGVSFGGMVAQELAVTWPERVERLALLCTSPGGAGGASYPLHEVADLAPAERAARMLPLYDSRFTPDWLAERAADRALVDRMAAAARDGEGKSDEQRRGEREQLDARRRHDVTERLGAIRCPTLVACGRYDGLAPPANSEAIVARVAGAELRVYDGGHGFFAQDRRALPEIFDFLSA
jgi:pimeloyl-ACP methyl ester carboxylesterase